MVIVYNRIYQNWFCRAHRNPPGCAFTLIIDRFADGREITNYYEAVDACKEFIAARGFDVKDYVRFEAKKC